MEAIPIHNQKPKSNIPHKYHIYIYLYITIIYISYVCKSHISAPGCQLSTLEIKEGGDPEPNKQRSVLGPRTRCLPENVENYHRSREGEKTLLFKRSWSFREWEELSQIFRKHHHLSKLSAKIDHWRVVDQKIIRQHNLCFLNEHM